VIEETIRAYAEAWRARDRRAWLATFAPDATQEDPIGSGVRRGQEQIGAFWDDAMASYEWIEIVPREIHIVRSEGVMVWTINGERTDGKVSFDGVDVFEFDDSGRIASVRAYWDRSAMRFS
jgi:steroid delta-isomerase